jgi:serine/threonine-protein kinase
MQRFLREVSILSRLSHPRIVRFLEMGMSAGQFLFAMEYVKPADLGQHLADRSTASRIKTICGIVCQTLEALRYAHGQGYIHRDIKPSNILLTRVGRKLGTKLADFGLAKQIENAGFSGLTRAGEAVGTLAFMAPEQITHSREARPTMDVYGAGATLYYLLSGKLPHEFAAGRDPVLVILEDEPRPLREQCPQVPSELASHVHRAIAKDPSDRFPTADAMWRSLAPYASG